MMLYIDIKNALNAVNNCAIFRVLEAYGFPKEVVMIELLCSLYSQSFLIFGNSFGQTALQFLPKGFFQGAPSNPTMFILTFDPSHKTIRASGAAATSLPWTLPLAQACLLMIPTSTRLALTLSQP